MLQAGTHYFTETGVMTIIKLLGKGKSGYSWLAENNDRQYVIKTMHDEKSAFYTFATDKLEAELYSYKTLKSLGINLPELIEYDKNRNMLVKEYVSGITAGDAVAEGLVKHEHLLQMLEYAENIEQNGYNIDYFPMNFIISKQQTIWYIDYEINPFLREWNFVNWGIYYWLNKAGMQAFLATGEASHINLDQNKGIPHKTEFEQTLTLLLDTYAKSKQ